MKYMSIQKLLYNVYSGIIHNFQLPIKRFGEGNGTLLQYSCLENPMDGGAW